MSSALRPAASRARANSTNRLTARRLPPAQLGPAVLDDRLTVGAPGLEAVGVAVPIVGARSGVDADRDLLAGEDGPGELHRQPGEPGGVAAGHRLDHRPAAEGHGAEAVDDDAGQADRAGDGVV